VLKIGGLKEKLLAAHRGGITTVIIPDDNGSDLKEIPDNIKADLKICQVKWIDEVLAIALEKDPESLSEEEFNRSSATQNNEASSSRPSTH
jgi:ATP-dependent Lon protease